jgi:hypothetical protein
MASHQEGISREFTPRRIEEGGMSKPKKVSVSTSGGTLAVMINGRLYYPKKRSAERLIGLLEKETPKSVLIDPEGPIVRYEFGLYIPPLSGLSGDNPPSVASNLRPH